jgi:hypothetical protein
MSSKTILSESIQLLQDDLVMARTFLRQDMGATKATLERMRRRIDYALENADGV